MNGPEPSLWRLFVAVPLPADARREVARWTERLRTRSERAGWRIGWVRPDNLHVTLRFLGGTPPEYVEPILAAVRTAATGMAPFPWSLRGVGSFGSPRRPRVLWLGIGEGAAHLHALAHAVRGAIESAGLPPEERPFRAHLTLGRVRRTGESEAFDRVLAPLRDTEIAAGRLERVVLYRSHLGPAGPRYEPLGEGWLREGDPVAPASS